MKKMILSFLVLLISVAEAKDLGFRFTDGKCINAKGVEGYNPSYLGQCGDLKGVVISNFNLDDTDLRGSVFDSSDLQGTTIRNSDLTGASFANSQLSGVDFTNTKLINVNMHGAILVNAHLADATLSNIDFSAADFSHAQLSFLDCQKCGFAKANLTGADLDSVNFSGADFSEAILRDTNLANALMDSVKIDGANLEKADLTDASFKGVSGEKIKANGISGKNANFEGSVLVSISIRKSQLENSNFKNSDLSMADFRGAALPGANLQATKLEGALISKRTVLPITLDEATKRGMAFAKASLLIIPDKTSNSSEIDSLLKYMNGEGIEATVSPKSRNQFDGTVDLADYTSILMLYGHSNDLPTGGQKALVKYVQGGGQYISTGMVNHMWSFHDYLRDMRDLQFMREDAQGTATHQFVASKGKEGHPLLEGIAGQSLRSGYSLCNKLESYGTNPPELIAVTEQGQPMIAVRNFGDGRAINLPFSASGDQEYAGMTDPMFQKFIGNAVNW